MKKETKKILFALVTSLLVVAICLAVTGCGESTSSDATSTLGTLPLETTAGTTAAETTTAETTEKTETTAETTTKKQTPTETTTEATTAEETTAKPPVYIGYTNPLTGMPTTKDLSTTRPVAIVVDNIKNALRNQTGVAQADVVYEALTAPGITRFLAVYADYTAIDTVCNIREASAYHMDLAAFHNAVLVAHGSKSGDGYDFDETALARYGSLYGYINTMVEPWFCQEKNGALYGTIAHQDERVDLSWDTVFTPSAMTALLKSKTYSKFVSNGGSLVGFPKKSLNVLTYGTTKSMAGASDATKFTLSFDTAKTVSYSYSSISGKYLRSQDGKAHMDGETGDQIAFTNVITLFTSTSKIATGVANDPWMTKVTTKGSGIGYYFYGGKVIQLSWSSDGNKLTLTDSLGQELTLAAGNTYIGFFDNSNLKGTFWY